MLATPVPERLWQHGGTDIFLWDKNIYLVVVDYFSQFTEQNTEVVHFHFVSANAVILALKIIFGQYGVPKLLMSNNGPQYACTLFKDVARECAFTHITSNPRYPQTNGEAEHTVATLKKLVERGRISCLSSTQLSSHSNGTLILQHSSSWGDG